jgi:DNA-nicking Smr family endonuclease
MRRRETSAEERALFARAFIESRPLKIEAKTKAKASKPAAKPSAARAPETSLPSGGGLDGHTAERLRRGRLEPEARLDLHGQTESVAHRALLAFLKSAHARKLRLVLVVTGKGARAAAGDHGASRGVLRTAVPRWLKEPQFANLVAASAASHSRHGGEGALYVYLKKHRR